MMKLLKEVIIHMIKDIFVIWLLFTSIIGILFMISEDASNIPDFLLALIALMESIVILIWYFKGYLDIKKDVSIKLIGTRGNGKTNLGLGDINPYEEDDDDSI